MTDLSLFALVLEQFVQWKYGVVASLLMAVLAVGRRAEKATTATCVGLVAVLLLLAR
jgi:hypothetical protein